VIRELRTEPSLLPSLYAVFGFSNEAYLVVSWHHGNYWIEAFALSPTFLTAAVAVSFAVFLISLDIADKSHNCHFDL